MGGRNLIHSHKLYSSVADYVGFAITPLRTQGCADLPWATCSRPLRGLKSPNATLLVSERENLTRIRHLVASGNSRCLQICCASARTLVCGLTPIGMLDSVYEDLPLLLKFSA